MTGKTREAGVLFKIPSREPAALKARHSPSSDVQASGCKGWGGGVNPQSWRGVGAGGSHPVRVWADRPTGFFHAGKKADGSS